MKKYKLGNTIFYYYRKEACWNRMTEFVDGWIFGHTLGEGAFGEYVHIFNLCNHELIIKWLNIKNFCTSEN